MRSRLKLTPDPAVIKHDTWCLWHFVFGAEQGGGEEDEQEERERWPAGSRQRQ